MRAGSLDRRIRIDQLGTSKDALNADVQRWTELATVSAAYEPVSDGERFRAGERAGEISARFRIRWSALAATVTPKHRVVFQGRILEIINVKEISRREGFELTVKGRGDQ